MPSAICEAFGWERGADRSWQEAPVYHGIITTVLVISTNRFYSEVWLFERNHRQFSAFDTIADLYFVRIPRSEHSRQPSIYQR